MSYENCNEITVKVVCSKEDLIKILEKNGFSSRENFTLNDYFFVPNNLDLESMTTREIISKAILVRDIDDNGRNNPKITYKMKRFNENGDIIEQSKVNCDVNDAEEAKALLNAIGYKEIMYIKENGTEYTNGELKLAIKDIVNGDLLIELETEKNFAKYDTLDKLKIAISDLQIPIEPNQYFVKKAEVELDKILKR